MKILFLLIAVCSASRRTRGLSNVRYHRSVLFLKIPLACRRAKVKFVEKQCFCDKKNQTSKEVLALIRRLRNAFASVPAKAQAATRVKTANKWKFHHDVVWSCCVDV
ncbi:hypothetical protein BDP67DRAFT_502412 [Colletotrichum lupini]|nr:hypothetical protein BDP67DRAFT_502412 [Colletotrichum lupini]